ncbi:LysM domain-containing protein [Sorangium sp. So ce185]|uniref:LysM domain-containing protein n=1 Tax=Sorangium sp. So ce185 TaxID=3133287 RepID=UPI003F615FC8
MLQRTSRYYNLERAEWTAPDGRTVLYVRRRFIPRAPPVALAEHVVAAGDRLDNVTARHLGDPEQFWRVCDANGAVRPDELTERVGRAIVIPLPQGP